MPVNVLTLHISISVYSYKNSTINVWFPFRKENQDTNIGKFCVLKDCHHLQYRLSILPLCIMSICNASTYIYSWDNGLAITTYISSLKSDIWYKIRRICFSNNNICCKMKTKEVSTYSTLKTKCSLLAFDNVVTRQHCIIIYMKKG